MSNSNTLLDELLRDWYDIRRGLIKELNSIPAVRMSFRPTLETRSFLDLAQHVLQYSIATMEELLREETNFQRATFDQLISLYAPNIHRADSQEKAVNILVEQYQDATERITRCGELHMMQLAIRTDGKKASRLSILQNEIAHEMYHRGQLTVYMRLLGLTPALTKEAPRPVWSAITDRV